MGIRGHIKLSVFGGVTLHDGDGNAVLLRSKKARALIGLLAVSPGMALPREKITGLLWSDNDEDRARASLRQCVKSIKSDLGAALGELVVSDREIVGLNREKIESDHELLVSLSDAGNFDHPVFLNEEVHATLLSGLDDAHEDFRSWLAIQREQLRRKLQTTLEGSLAGDKSVSSARALLLLDPSHEPALRIVMQAEADRDNRPGALRLFDAFQERLKQEYGAKPSLETVRLAEAVKAEASTPAAPSGQTPALTVLQQGAVPVIAVVSAIGGNVPALESLASSLLRVLSRFRNFSVISVNSAEEALREQSGKAVADYLLRFHATAGSGSRMQLNLSERHSGAVIWSANVSAEAGGHTDQQEDVIRGLCGALKVYLSESQIKRLQIKNPHDQTAIEKWIRSQHLLTVWQPDTEVSAEKLLEEAIRAAPDHALMHANLADIYNSRHIVHPGAGRDADLERKAMELARRAVSLDPLEPRSHVTFGWSLALAGKPTQAIFSFLRGYELNPADPDLCMSAAHGVAICGDVDTGYRLKKEAFAYHPSPPWSFWGFDSHIRFLAEDFAGSVQSVERSGEIENYILGWKAAALGMLGHADAPETGREFLDRAKSRWIGTRQPDPQAVTEWFVSIFPFGRDRERNLLREGLRRAGLPA